MLRNFLLTFVAACAALLLAAGPRVLRLWLRDRRRSTPPEEADRAE